MSLISDAEKAIYSQVMVDLAETFEQDITIYNFPEQTVIASDANFNHFYQNSEPFTQAVPVSGTFKARVKYLDKPERQLNNQGGNESQVDVTEDLGDLRIKVRPEAFSWIKVDQGIEVNGEKFELASAPRPHGLFNIQFYTFYFRRAV